MIIEVPDGFAVLWSCMAWALASVAIGGWGARLDVERLAEGPVTRLRRWERGGRRWDHVLAVSRWKDRVPEAGTWMGGTSKRRLTSRRTEDLERFAAETVRAERVHWLIVATTPLHALWCRPNILAGMVAFGLAANIPCVLIQRYNRGRLQRILRRRTSAPARSPQVDRASAPRDPAQDQGRER